MNQQFFQNFVKKQKYRDCLSFFSCFFGTFLNCVSKTERIIHAVIANDFGVIKSLLYHKKSFDKTEKKKVAFKTNCYFLKTKNATLQRKCKHIEYSQINKKMYFACFFQIKTKIQQKNRNTKKKQKKT